MLICLAVSLLNQTEYLPLEVKPHVLIIFSLLNPPLCLAQPMDDTKERGWEGRKDHSGLRANSEKSEVSLCPFMP